MIKRAKLKTNRSFLIAGFGLEGRFAYNYIKKEYPGAEIAIADLKRMPSPDKEVKFYYGPNNLKRAKIIKP